MIFLETGTNTYAQPKIYESSDEPPATMKLAALLSILLGAHSASAFMPLGKFGLSTGCLSAAENQSFDPLHISDGVRAPAVTAVGVAATVATAFAASPLAAIAAESEEYEYGAVDAPIGIAVGGGLLAILTALLPVVMSGGEEAFDEMKDRDSEKWGK